MKLIVLGNYGPYPKAGCACSGFLLISEEAKVLIDCGSGVISRLQQYIDIAQLDAVILSHLHCDHTADILTLSYAAEIKIKKGQMNGPLKIFMPEEPHDEAEMIQRRRSFEPVKMEDGKEFRLKDIKITFRKMEHSYQNYAISIKKDRKKFVYSGDTMPNEALMEFAKDADLFLCEAALLERDEKAMRAMHLTAHEAGEIAKQAGVRRLLLTHFLPNIRVEYYITEAASAYNGIMEAAEEGKTYFI